MEQAQSEVSGSVTGEEANTPAPSSQAVSTSVLPREVNEAQRVVPTRRKLSDEQEREVTRLYAETSTLASEIAQTFGIGESSVYRVAQRHGAALRGRQTRPGAPPRQHAPSRPRGRPAARAASEVASTVATAPTQPRVSGSKVRPPVGGTSLRQFRIRFLAERVVRAKDIQAVLRQAESLGAIEVTAVVRED
jgi:transposase-like protein